MSTQQRITRCGLCREHGHNKRTCPSKHVTMRSEERKQTMSMKKETKKECEEKDDTCAICFEDCGKCRTTLECGHTFDTKCIFKWLSKNKSCPCCRTIVPSLSSGLTRRELPCVEMSGAIYELCVDAVGERFRNLGGKEQVKAWYMMFKMEMESLSDDEYIRMIRMGYWGRSDL